ncbi:MAG: hypothetical protein Kow0013_16510 [Pararhodobacter sp.]
MVPLRVGLAAPALAAMLPLLSIPFLRGGGFLKGAAAWRAPFAMGVLDKVIPFTRLVLAQEQISSGPASILNATTPLWGVVLAHRPTRDERLARARALGVLTGFGGVALMMGAALAQLACLGATFSHGCAGSGGDASAARALRPSPRALARSVADRPCSCLWR